MLNHEGGRGRDRKVLETYTPLRLDGRIVGAFELYQDYAPVAAAARQAFLPVAAAFALALLVLYAAHSRPCARLAAPTRVEGRRRVTP